MSMLPFDPIRPAAVDDLSASGAKLVRDDRDRAVACARAILRGNYPVDSAPVVVAAYLLRTLGLSP